MSEHPPFSPEQSMAIVASLAQALIQRGERLCTAESCTGGLIAAACTDLPGSSQWFEGGFVTYSNASKAQWLGVDAKSIEKHGAVSQTVVEHMALGALKRCPDANWAIAISGIAGPGGSTTDKPVGTVWTAWAYRSSGAGDAVAQGLQCDCQQWSGDRAAIRQQATMHALVRLCALMQAQS